MRVLDLECDYGSLCKYFSDNYGVEEVGLIISKEQYKLAIEYCEGSNCKILSKDYRDIEEKFDRIVLCEMLMHVGEKIIVLFSKLFNIV